MAGTGFIILGAGSAGCILAARLARALPLRGDVQDGTRRARASVIPTTVSGNTAAATMMIAARGAELVLLGS